MSVASAFPSLVEELVRGAFEYKKKKDAPQLYLYFKSSVKWSKDSVCEQEKVTKCHVFRRVYPKKFSSKKSKWREET